MYGKNDPFSHKLTDCNLHTLRCENRRGTPAKNNGETCP